MSLIALEDRGAVRHVVLNRPEKRNAFDERLIRDLGVALRDAADDDAIRVVVLRGEGRMFSSGMDLTLLRELGDDPSSLRASRREILATWNLAEEMPKPVIAQVHGACIGGAMELALACDLRVMADDAVFAIPETRIGLVPDVGGSSRLPAVVGLGRAKELIMTGRPIGAPDAFAWGLVNRVAPADELDATTQQLADDLLACAPLAVGLAKRLLDAAAKPGLALTLEQEVAAQQLCAQSEDFAEGARAFLEKRVPAFAGR